jgi:opacity protein-like surface antigen
MKYFICLLVSLCVTSTATIVLAEQGQYFSKGDTEIGFHGSYNYISVDVDNESENIDFFYADLEASYYLIDNLSVGVSTVWFYLPEISNFTAYALGLEGNARYHFQVNQHFVPYIGAHAGYYYADADIDGTSESDSINSYGVHAGFKVPINDNVFFDTQLKWTDYNLPWDGIKLSATQFLLGLKIKF